VVVADHLFVAVAGVYGWFEDFHLLLGKLCTAQTANQLFGLSGEHGTTHYFYSSWAACLARCGKCNHAAKIRFFRELKKLKELKGVKGQ
jgi:hypothetical protein